MRAQVNSSDKACLPLWRLFICVRHCRVVVAAWLFTCCVLVDAEDSKPTDHTQTPAAQHRVTTPRDGKATTSNGSDAACKIKSDDPAVRTNTGAAALPAERDGQERMSRASDKPASGESLTLQAPSREDWTKDQIHLTTETTLGEASRRDKSDASTPGSDMKCTPHEAAPKTELATPN